MTSVPPSEAEELLAKLAAIAGAPVDIVDIYERQIGRCKSPADRVRALARASQVAASMGQIERAKGLFELALSGAPADETLATLETGAREGDAQTGGEQLRRALSVAMAAGGQGARDGGKTRGSLLRRAASLAHRDLGDVDLALNWLGDALIVHVDPITLDALEGLALEIGDARRAEETLSRALTEVFDGPLVRQLLARRAKLRRDHLDDRTGAAADLKKLHDLAPQDQTVIDELTALLVELGDHPGMVQLYEDQILRGKDMAARAELARKVARMWEEQLGDPREAADAWRRVLRMKQGDAEATAGLERAKSNMLKKPDVGADRPSAAGSQREVGPAPPPAPSSRPTAHDDSTAPQKAEQLAASLRAALAPEPEDDDPTDLVAHDNDGRPQRPQGLLFRRASSEEATLSAPIHHAESARMTKVADDERLAAMERELAVGAPNEARNGETSGIDFFERGAGAGELRDSRTVFGDSGEHATAAGEEQNGELDLEEEDFDDDLIVVDELSELTGSEDEAKPAEMPPEERKPKRSTPPPIPRH